MRDHHHIGPERGHGARQSHGQAHGSPGGDLPRLDPERYAKARRFLRVVGPIVLGAGVVCMVIAFVGVIASMNSMSFGPPRAFFLFFVGMPLIFVGLIMTVYGYKRVLADYAASELSPVASGAVNYFGASTQDGVRAFGGALREGMHGEGTVARHCTQCGVRLAIGARFCQGCGVAVQSMDDSA